MDKQILFFTLSLACIYFILDEFVGNKRITAFTASLFSGTGSVDFTPDSERDGVEDGNDMTPEEENKWKEGQFTSTAPSGKQYAEGWNIV